MTRVCKKCLCEKPITEFRVNRPGYYRGECRECGRRLRKEWGALNREWANEYCRTYRKAHPSLRTRFNEYRKIWRSRPGEKQLFNRLADRLRVRVRQALAGNPKNSTTMRLVGCSIEQLVAHLEKQFKPGMAWENYGKWEIDHVVPCAKFDLTDSAQQRECFHYTNLQPLWALDNLRKGAR